MKFVSIILAALLAGEFLFLGMGKLAAITPMRERAEHLGFTTTAYRIIGALEVAAAVGVLAGLASPSVGIAAGIGLTVLMTGAMAAHLRNRDGAMEIAPAVVTGVVAVAYSAALAGAIL
ncbi:DoxX family protein [Nocardia niigatensis]|uniref:DoxX family protein n=1 Tax=Nocardia niigatensis TaxID=209249 RepID=UPI00030AE8CF|nr:DoxX family protein [Nocardia niigatensis]